MLPFQHAVAADLSSVNDMIIKELHSDVGLVENIGHYIVDAGGKRLRPILVLLTAKCLEYPGQRHVDLATIIEFIHTATLLHDDVVDMSDLRRGRPTANARFGNAPSVLVGDFLYSRAFQMLVRLGSMEIMDILSNTTNVISEGEVQQLINARNPSVSEADYLTVIHKKTAALFEAACQTAAVLAGAGEAQKRAAWQFGHHLGLAFQLLDDLLDYEGDQAALGKNIGDDLAEGKPTLPLIHAMAHTEGAEQDLIREAITHGRIDHLADILALIRRCGSLDYTRRKAGEHAQAAEVALAALPDNSWRRAMEELARFSVSRTY
ncbi:MAG: octaprenyl diphosphate synthase [Cellvibrionaceae bacterium]|nr:octaprenyl diphosphate synthase [Cellvibrionaceae bacterium]